jgi:mono/diheme cytochrome c family protein
MRSASFVLIIAVCCLSSVACAESTSSTNRSQATTAPSPAAPPAASVDQFAAARTNFQKYCSACHGDTGEGGLVKVDEKRLKVPTLKAGHALTHSDEQLNKQINNGGDGMPAFKTKLKPDEITGLVHFIRHEFQQDKTPMKGMKMD